jgi:hypothetical protein
MRNISPCATIRQPCQSGRSRPWRSRSRASPTAVPSTVTVRSTRQTDWPGRARTCFRPRLAADIHAGRDIEQRPLERAFRVNQHISNVLHVAGLPLAATYFEKRVLGSALCVGRIEQQHAPNPGAPARGQRPVLALDVVHDGRARPDQKGWHDQSHAFAASGGRKAQHMLRTVATQVWASSGLPLLRRREPACAKVLAILGIQMMSLATASRDVGCGSV